MIKNSRFFILSVFWPLSKYSQTFENFQIFDTTLMFLTYNEL